MRMFCIHVAAPCVGGYIFPYIALPRDEQNELSEHGSWQQTQWRITAFGSVDVCVCVRSLR